MTLLRQDCSDQAEWVGWGFLPLDSWLLFIWQVSFFGAITVHPFLVRAKFDTSDQIPCFLYMQILVFEVSQNFPHLIPRNTHCANRKGRFDIYAMLYFRSHDCDIRIQLPNVSKEHARIDVSPDGEVFVNHIFVKCDTECNSKDVQEILRCVHLNLIIQCKNPCYLQYLCMVCRFS